MDIAWWQDCIVYQIYPRSFQDSNNDGIGDLQGIIQRLDYIKSLGVDAIWLNPIFTSPMADFGYDISDYRGIDPIFGTMADADLLIEKAHEYSLKVIFDLVLNHTSDKHPWFLESRKSRDSEKADYYIWNDTVPNNWKGAFGGKGWTFDKQRGQFYFHSFLPQQPDLNWRNPATVDSLFGEVRFWLEKGVDGFRLDVINTIVKDKGLRDNPKAFGHRPRPYDMQRHIFDRNRPESHSKVKMLRKLVDTFPDRMLVGEIMVENPGEPELAASYLGKAGEELNLSFDFSLITTSFSAQKWQRAAKRWYEAVGMHRTPTWVMNNHDVGRSISRFSNNEKKTRLATFFQLTQKGTIFLYYGEELGLRNSSICRKDLQDPLGRRYWPFHRGRDAQRGPMVWEMGGNHGFSECDPWLPFTKHANWYTVESQELEPDSMLSFYRSLIELRSNEPALRQGNCVFLEQKNTSLIVYTRILDETQFLVLVNFSSEKQSASLGEFGLHSSDSEEIFSTTSVTKQPRFSYENVNLDGYEGVLFRINKQ
jgi:alpha-glucosidase